MADAAEELTTQLFGETEQTPPEPQQKPEPPPPRAPDVPLATYLDLQAEARDLRKQAAEWKAQQEAKPKPDFYDDPEAVLATERQQAQEREWKLVETMSSRFAEQAHGAETVKAAREWAGSAKGQDPYFYQRYRSDPDPTGFLVNEYKRDQLIQQVGEDPDAYVRRRAAEMGLGSQPPPVAPQRVAARPATPSTPPKSLASAPSSGPASSQAPTSALEGAFARLK